MKMTRRSFCTAFAVHQTKRRAGALLSVGSERSRALLLDGAGQPNIA